MRVVTVTVIIALAGALAAVLVRPDYRKPPRSERQLLNMVAVVCGDLPSEWAYNSLQREFRVTCTDGRAAIVRDR